MKRIVYYLNQFFGQVGGESEAGYPLTVQEGPVGAAKAFAAQIAQAPAEVVATIVCGDNYFTENTEKVQEEIEKIFQQYQPDILVAGPAFNAGRYGMACGAMMKIAQQKFGIPAVSAMYEENPGLELYRLYGYIFPTDINARSMRTAMKKISDFVQKLAGEGKILGPEEEGYFKRGVRKNIWYEKTGAVRAVDMMLKKLREEPFETELPMPKFSKVPPSPAIKDLSKATIAVMTSGGIVPRGNPDHLEALSCTKYHAYSKEDFGGEKMDRVDVAHGGYDPTYALEDGNRVLPIEAVNELARRGVIGGVYDKYYVTVGNSMPVDRATMFGDAIAKDLLGKVDAVILTST